MSRNIRDVSPFLQKLRNFLLGRDHTLAVRFQDTIATRSPPLPELPDGPSHCLAANYYYSRDGRREATPPEVIVSEQKLIASGETSPVQKPVKSRTPGQIYQWD